MSGKRSNISTVRLAGVTTRGLLSRRTVLRGLGTALALPLLDAMVPASRLVAATSSSAGSSAGAGVVGPPLRMGFVFVPNGVNLKHWTPSTLGKSYELPNILRPLASFRDDLLVLSGLTHDKGRANGDGAGDHARCASVFLTGSQPTKTSGAGIRSGVSVDQLVAQARGHETRFASLELCCEGGGNSGNCDSGYSCAYSNNISWASSTTPMAKEIDPRRVFDRLFANDVAADVATSRGRIESRKKSLLDFVLGDARRLHESLGRGDQRKIDEYLTSVRDIERRVRSTAKIASQSEIEAPENLPESAGSRLDYRDHIRLMCDMMCLAYRGDVTRVSTFMFAKSGSNRNYRNIQVPNGHHELSHHQGRPDKLDKIRKINHFHVEQFAYLLEKLKSTPEGEGSLLDNCMIVYGSALSDGNRHNNEDLPVLLAGQGRGSIDSGRHVRYEAETPMCNLFLSMLDRMEVPVDSHGDSTGRLRQLTL